MIVAEFADVHSAMVTLVSTGGLAGEGVGVMAGVGVHVGVGVMEGAGDGVRPGITPTDSKGIPFSNAYCSTHEPVYPRIVKPGTILSLPVTAP